jgi:hypothetical protein
MHARLTIGLAMLTLAAAATPAAAGCGCDKPPPPAEVRPHAAYPGAQVTLFHPALEAGAPYVVAFRSGTTSETAVITADAISRRDLADGRAKAQLVVPVPPLPLGPAALEVYGQEPADQPLL